VGTRAAGASADLVVTTAWLPSRALGGMTCRPLRTQQRKIKRGSPASGRQRQPLLLLPQPELAPDGVCSKRSLLYDFLALVPIRGFCRFGYGAWDMPWASS